MKDSTKLISCIFTVCAAFIVLRIFETVHIFKFTSAEPSQDAEKLIAASFEIYRDFITIITGLLTLVFGATGFLAYFSFKKLRDDERNILDKLENEKDQISRLRAAFEEKIESDSKKIDKILNNLKMHEKINIAQFVLRSEVDKTPAIEILKEAETLCADSYVLYQMKGDALYYRGDPGDYVRAIEEYDKANKRKEDSADIWFGISQSKFKSSLNEQDGTSATVLLHPDDYMRFELVKNHHDTANESKVKEAIKDMERANSCGLSLAQAGLELGHMYRAIGDSCNALKMYKKAFESNKKHMVSGFFYCHLWIMNNMEYLHRFDAKSNEIVEVVDILKSVGLLDIYNWKEAYALLWFLYKIVPGLGTKNDIESSLASTNRYIISKLFKIRNTADSTSYSTTSQSNSTS